MEQHDLVEKYEKLLTDYNAAQAVLAKVNAELYNMVTSHYDYRFDINCPYTPQRRIDIGYQTSTKFGENKFRYVYFYIKDIFEITNELLIYSDLKLKFYLYKIDSELHITISHDCTKLSWVTFHGTYDMNIDTFKKLSKYENRDNILKMLVSSDFELGLILLKNL